MNCPEQCCFLCGQTVKLNCPCSSPILAFWQFLGPSSGVSLGTVGRRRRQGCGRSCSPAWPVLRAVPWAAAGTGPAFLSRSPGSGFPQCCQSVLQKAWMSKCMLLTSDRPTSDVLRGKTFPSHSFLVELVHSHAFIFSRRLATVISICDFKQICCFLISLFSE